MKLVSAPLNNPFSVSFAQVDVTEPMSGMQDANPTPEIFRLSNEIWYSQQNLFAKNYENWYNFVVDTLQDSTDSQIGYTKGSR